MSALTQTIKIPVTTGTQFWNVIPNRVESSVKNFRYVLMIEPVSNPYPVSPSNMRITPTVSAIMMTSVIAEPMPEFFTSGCSRPLRGSRCQKPPMLTAIKAAPQIMGNISLIPVGTSVVLAPAG
jgi:hypothetical protein